MVLVVEVPVIEILTPWIGFQYIYDSCMLQRLCNNNHNNNNNNYNKLYLSLLNDCYMLDYNEKKDQAITLNIRVTCK